MTNQDSTKPVIDAVFDLNPHTPHVSDTTAREHAQWKLLAKDGPFPAPADSCDVWVGNTRDLEAGDLASLAELMSSICSVGQQVPAIARISPSNPARLEIIAGACRLTAIRRINDSRPADDQQPIIVELRKLDSEAAFKIVDAENRGRSAMSPFEKARFYERAIEGVYHNELALAEALGLNKSTVNRTLAITRLPAELMALIKDRHEISAAQASVFLRNWNIPELRETLSETIDELTSEEPMTAAAVFKALREGVAPSAEAETATILHDGVEVGSLRRGNGGITIKLLPSAEAVVLRPLVIGIGNALKQIGFK